LFNSRDGEAIWLTRDHKVSDADEQERLKKLGPQAWHPGKSRINGLAVSRAMGDFFVKNEGLGLIGEPFVSQVYKIEPNDSILIVASDGVRTSLILVSLFPTQYRSKHGHYNTALGRDLGSSSDELDYSPRRRRRNGKGNPLISLSYVFTKIQTAHHKRFSSQIHRLS